MENHLEDEAKEDMRSLDGSQRVEVFRSIKKVSQNPMPYNEGGYGKPLGNKKGSELAGCLKIKLRRLGIRIVYILHRTECGMEILEVKQPQKRQYRGDQGGWQARSQASSL